MGLGTGLVAEVTMMMMGLETKMMMELRTGVVVEVTGVMMGTGTGWWWR